MSSIDPTALKAEVVSILTDAEEVLAEVAKFDDLPVLDKVAPFVTDAQKVLVDVLEFLNTV